MDSNELAKQRIEENIRTKAPHLDLSFCDLYGNEPALEMLAECTHLKYLNMSCHGRHHYDRENCVWHLHTSPEGDILQENNVEFIPDGLPPSLEELCIGGNVDGPCPLTDLEPLTRLTNLKYLYLDCNQVSDITPLQQLPQLEALCISENHLVDISPLAYLRNLSFLDIGVNDSLEDISPLQYLTNLRCLKAEVCNISDMSPLASLHNLEVLEIGYNCEIHNLTPLSYLTNLRKLCIGGDDGFGRDMSALAALGKLEVLTLEGNSFAEEAHYDEEEERQRYKFALPELPSLKTLNLKECGLKDLLLPYLPKLSSLDASENQLTEFLPEILKQLPQLEDLHLRGNPIENLPKGILDVYEQGNCLPQIKAFFAQNK